MVLFERALEWRTSEREIARGVTLHNLGLALRKAAELEPSRSEQLLGGSADALREAVAIRTRNGLPEGRALSLFHLALTLEALGELGEARAAYQTAAREFEDLGKADSAAVARARLDRVGSAD